MAWLIHGLMWYCGSGAKCTMNNWIITGHGTWYIISLLHHQLQYQIRRIHLSSQKH